MGFVSVQWGFKGLKCVPELFKGFHERFKGFPWVFRNIQGFSRSVEGAL